MIWLSLMVVCVVAAGEGCTEIVLLVQPQHTNIPLFDTTAIHAAAAVDWALAPAG